MSFTTVPYGITTVPLPVTTDGIALFRDGKGKFWTFDISGAGGQYQPLNSTLTYIANHPATAYGLGFLGLATANAAINYLGLGSILLEAPNTLIGNNTGTTRSPLALTPGQVKVMLSLQNVENIALSTWPGSPSLTTLGTITTGTWQGNPITNSYGGVKSGGATGYVLTKNSGTSYDYDWAPAPGGGGGGTVTSVSVIANDGITQSVATATTTPAITLGLGAITPTSISTGAGSFTSILATGLVSGTGFQNLFASPYAIGVTAPNIGVFTTLDATGLVTFNQSPVNPGVYAGTILHVSGSDSSTARVLIDAFSAVPVLSLRTALGTSAVPSGLTAGTQFGAITAFGFGSSSYPTSGSAAISFIASENFTNTANGTEMIFQVTPLGSTTRSTAVQINQDKTVIFYNSLYLGVNSNEIVNVSPGNMSLASGAYFNGAQFVANTTTPTVETLSATGLTLYSNTGATIGSPYTLNAVAQINFNRAIFLVPAVFSSTVSITDGSAATPSTFFTNDTNTGFFRVGADTIGLSTGGIKTVEFNGAGNVRMKTISTGFAVGSMIETVNDYGDWYWGVSSDTAGSGIIYTATIANLYVFTNATLRTTVSTAGLDVVGRVTGQSTATGSPTARTFANRFADIINIKDFGADPSASAATNKAAINAALAALTNYSSLYIPQGKYNIDGPLNQLSSLNHITIYGDGWSSEIHSTETEAIIGSAAMGALQAYAIVTVGTTNWMAVGAPANAVGIRFVATGPAAGTGTATQGTGNTFVFDSSCSYINVRDLSVTGSATFRGSGIHFRMYSGNSSIKNCYVAGCSDFAIHLSNSVSSWSSNFEVSGCTVVSPIGDGIHVGNATDVIISDCIIKNTGDDGIGVVADDPSHIPNRVKISDCEIYAAGGTTYSVSGCGIRVAEATDVTIEDCDIYYPYEAGVRLTRYLGSNNNTRIRVVDNHILGGGGHIGSNSIDIGYANYCMITDNDINGGITGVGIWVLEVQDTTISRNKIRGMPSGGIYTDSVSSAAATWNGFTVKDNEFAAIAANQAIYLVPAAGITIQNMIIEGNVATGLSSGAFVYCDRITTGRIWNNTNTGGYTITTGGSVSGITSGNNN